MSNIRKILLLITSFILYFCRDVAINVASNLITKSSNNKRPSSSIIHQADQNGLVETKGSYESITTNTCIKIDQAGNIKIKSKAHKKTK